MYVNPTIWLTADTSTMAWAPSMSDTRASQNATVRVSEMYPESFSSVPKILS